MPDLVGRQLSEVKQRLGSFEGTVEVVFPERIATRTVEPKVTLRPPESRIETVHYPARRMKLQPDVLGHEVAAQDPAPGTPIDSETTIVLTPGGHPGEAVRPWIYGHIDAVRTHGANPCFECHDPKGCSDCHLGFE